MRLLDKDQNIDRNDNRSRCMQPKDFSFKGCNPTHGWPILYSKPGKGLS